MVVGRDPDQCQLVDGNIVLLQPHFECCDVGSLVVPVLDDVLDRLSQFLFKVLEFVDLLVQPVLSGAYPLGCGLPALTLRAGATEPAEDGATRFAAAQDAAEDVADARQDFVAPTASRLRFSFPHAILSL